MQRTTQPDASGYDIMTQVYGGLLWMVPQTGEVRKLDAHGSRFESYFEVWAGGKGAPTGPTMHDTIAWLGQEDRWMELESFSSQMVASLVDFFTSNLPVAAMLREMGNYRQFFSGGPHFPIQLRKKLEELAGLDQTWSYKTTGAGGEDSLLLVGPRDATQPARECLQRLGWHPLPGKLGVVGIERKDGASWQPMFM